MIVEKVLLVITQRMLSLVVLEEALVVVGTGFGV
jgi:hypothetical protein